MHRAARVPSLDPVIGCHEIRAVARLVPQRPDNNGGVVLIAFHHPYGTVHVRVQPFGRVGQRLATVSHAVAFNIRFIYHVQAVLVAQIVPGRLVRVMRGAHGIDIVLLHDQDIFDHTFQRYGLSEVRIGLMAVHTFD